MLFIHSNKSILIFKNAYSKYCQGYKKMAIKKFKNVVFENSYRRTGFPYSMKQEKALVIAYNYINRKNT